MEEEDAVLLAAVCEGSERAFNRLVDRYQQAVRNFLRRVIGRGEADDVAQETFLAVWTQARSFRGGSPVRSWVFGIAWRKVKDAQRSGYRRRRRETDWQKAADDDRSDDGGEMRHALEQALVTLSIDQRAAVMLCLAYGFSHAEAAEVLHMPLGTVKSHVTRGRDKLREVLGDEDDARA
jgi:RNA polymerase sigma-70 factor (ECF subfamily)